MRKKDESEGGDFLAEELPLSSSAHHISQSVGIACITVAGKLVHANKSFRDITGCSRAELNSASHVLERLGMQPAELDGLALSAEKNLSVSVQKRIVKKGKQIVWIDITVTPLGFIKLQPDILVVSIRDISEARMYQLHAERLRRLYHVLTAVNSAIANASDKVSLFKAVCERIVEDKQLQICYIAELRGDGMAEVVAAAGVPLAELKAIELVGAKGPMSRGPIGMVLKNGRYDVCNNFQTDKRMQPWRKKLMNFSCGSTGAFPIFSQGKLGAILVLGADEAEYFQKDEVDLMNGISRNLGYSLDSLDNFQALRTTEANLRARQIELTETESRFRQLAENIGDVVWLSNLDRGKMFYVSPAFETLWGIPCAELISNPGVWVDAIHSEDRAQILQRHLRSPMRNHYAEEYRIVRPDGSLRWISERAFLIPEADGKPYRLAGIARDVTELRSAIDATEKLNRRLIDTLENLTDGYYELNKSWKFTYMNAQYLEMFSLANDDTLGKTVWEVFPEVDGTSHGHVLREAMRDGQVAVLEDYYAPFRRWYEVRVYPTSEGLSVYVRDTTRSHEDAEALRRERERLVHAQAVGHIGSWETDLETLDVVWSEETFRIFELEPSLFRPTHDSFLSFVHPDDRQRVDAAFRDSFETAEVCYVKHRILLPSGLIKVVEERWQTMRDDNGKVVKAFGTCQDITERERVAAENRNLAERLQTTLESITDAFFTLDLDWNFTYVNHEAERLLQSRREDLLGKNIWEVFHEAKDGGFDFQYEYAMRTGQTVRFERLYKPLNMWVDVRAFPSEQGLAVYFRDIGDEVEAKQALQASESRFREFAEKIQEIFYLMDARNAKITYISPAYEKVWGRSCESLLKNPTEYLDYIHPSDRKSVEVTFPKLLQGEFVEIEYRIFRPDGSTRWIRDYSYPVRDESNQVDHIVGVSHDITEQKQIEDRLVQQASLLDKATDAILVRDLEHKITFWNKGAERLYGWAAHEVLGRTAPSILYKDAEAFWAAWSRIIVEGEWSGELRQITREGREVIVEARWTLVKNAAGIPISVLAINTDVTERRQMEQQFLRAQRLESIGTLAGGVAHDLNNVLTPILMATGILKKNPQEKKADLLDIIESSAQRGADMVAQVLAFARGVEGERTRINLIPMLDDVVKIVRDTFPKKISIYSEVDLNLRDIVGDATQLQQVLLNLCVNARDALPGGGTITLAANNIDIDQSFAVMHPQAATGAYVLLEVADTGVGIPPDIIDRIFDPFFTTKAPGEGTGFGLSTSLAIVKGHGGFLTVDSKVSKGTWFRIYLPAGQTGEKKADASLSSEIPRGAGELILVVDDEAPIRRILCQTLEEHGYRVITAVDGAEGLARYAEWKNEIRLVLSDLMMPVMDGPSFAHVLKKMAPDLSIVVTSGVATDEVLARLYEIGVTDFLQKPYTADKLLRLLHKKFS